jgi:hypothetical protein
MGTELATEHHMAVNQVRRRHLWLDGMHGGGGVGVG